MDGGGGAVNIQICHNVCTIHEIILPYKTDTGCKFAVFQLSFINVSGFVACTVTRSMISSPRDNTEESALEVLLPTRLNRCKILLTNPKERGAGTSALFKKKFYVFFVGKLTNQQVGTHFLCWHPLLWEILNPRLDTEDRRKNEHHEGCKVYEMGKVLCLTKRSFNNLVIPSCPVYSLTYILSETVWRWLSGM